MDTERKPDGWDGVDRIYRMDMMRVVDERVELLDLGAVGKVFRLAGLLVGGLGRA